MPGIAIKLFIIVAVILGGILLATTTKVNLSELGLPPGSDGQFLYNNGGIVDAINGLFSGPTSAQTCQPTVDQACVTFKGANVGSPTQPVLEIQDKNGTNIAKFNPDGSITAGTGTNGTISGAIIQPLTYAFVNLPASADGSQVFCSNCNATCTAAGGTGRMCFRENGLWTH